MRVRVDAHYSERCWIIEGTRRSVRAQLLLLFPWLRVPAREQGFTVEALLELLDIHQGYSAYPLPLKARPARS